MLTIPRIREIVTPICRQYGVQRTYLFGSYARGEATEQSDVDLRIEPGRIHSLLVLSAFRLDLVDALGKEVDVVSALPEDEEFRRELSRDEVLLYAA